MYSNGVRLWKFRCHWKELPNCKIHCCSKSPEFTPEGGVWNESGQDLRARVHKNRTKTKILGERRKIDFAYILTIDRPSCEINQNILCLAEYRFVFEKIDNS